MSTDRRTQRAIRPDLHPADPPTPLASHRTGGRTTTIRTPRSTRLFGLALLLALALAAVTTAQAQVRFEPTAAGFASGPDKVGVTLAHSDAGLVARLVPAGTGALPDADTGFKGDVPTDALGRTHAQGALNLSEALTSLPGGVLMHHSDVSLRDLATAYQAALRDLGYTTMEDSSSGNGRVITFASDSGNVRLTLSNVDGGVNAYLGR